MKQNHQPNKRDEHWSEGTAYIVETREHQNLFLVIKNADQCLPEKWKIIIFCSDENYQYVTRIKEKITGREILLKPLSKLIKTVHDYNDLLFSTSFWYQFDTENLLGFQVDSWLSVEQKNELSKIAQYDYVGAPWSERIQRRWSYIPSIGGNGGVCFSKRSARLKALNTAKEPRISSAPHNQVLNEDIWFSLAINKVGGRIPERSKAINWFVESVYSENPFAVHKPWSYITAQEFQYLCEKNPGLEAIKNGFNVPSKTKIQTKNVSYRKFLLNFSRQCLREKNFHEADLALQVSQSRFENDPIAYNLQAMLAHQLGLYEKALEFVDIAISINDKFIKAIENKKIITKVLIEQRKAERSEKNSRYLLINSWGSGLGFDLLYLLKQLLIAEVTQRKPIIYWGQNSLYNDDLSHDCFTNYFEDISSASMSDVRRFKSSCYPNFWQDRELSDFVRKTKWRDAKNKQLFKMTGLYYLKRDENLLVSGEFTTIKMLQPWIPKSHRLYGSSVEEIYRDLMHKYIRPKDFLKSQADDFIETAFSDKAYIALHLRGTDKGGEKQSADIDNINQGLIEEVSKLDQTMPIFVMTDDVRQIKKMKEIFGQRVKSIDVTRSDGNDFGVHHTAKNKSKIAYEVIVDMLVATQATYFYGCGFSYLACCVEAMRSESQFTLLQPFNVLSRFMDIPTVGRFGIE